MKNEAERDKKEAAEQEKLFQLERFGRKILLFYLPTDEIIVNCLHQYYQLILSECIPVIEVPRADDIFFQTVTSLFFRFRKQAEQMESFHRAEVCN